MKKIFTTFSPCCESFGHLAENIDFGRIILGIDQISLLDKKMAVIRQTNRLTPEHRRDKERARETACGFWRAQTAVSSAFLPTAYPSDQRTGYSDTLPK